VTYRHVLFDIDGTLIDTEQMLITVFSDVLRRRYRCELTIDMFRSTFGLPCDVALRAIGLEPQQSVMDEIQQGIRRSLHLARLFPGIDELIRTLQGLHWGWLPQRAARNFKAALSHLALRRISRCPSVLTTRRAVSPIRIQFYTIWPSRMRHRRKLCILGIPLLTVNVQSVRVLILSWLHGAACPLIWQAILPRQNLPHIFKSSLLAAVVQPQGLIPSKRPSWCWLLCVHVSYVSDF